MFCSFSFWFFFVLFCSLRFPREPKHITNGIHTTLSFIRNENIDIFRAGPAHICVYTSCGLKSNTGSRVYIVNTDSVSGALCPALDGVLFDVSRQDIGADDVGCISNRPDERSLVDCITLPPLKERITKKKKLTNKQPRGEEKFFFFFSDRNRRIDIFHLYRENVVLPAIHLRGCFFFFYCFFAGRIYNRMMMYMHAYTRNILSSVMPIKINDSHSAVQQRELMGRVTCCPSSRNHLLCVCVLWTCGWLGCVCWAACGSSI